MEGKRSCTWAALALVLVSACGGATTAPPATVAPTATPDVAHPVARAAAPPTAAPRGPRHVFIIVLENRSPAEALRGPYIASLAERYASATNYFGVARPSLPNYLALTSGDTHGITDDAYYVLPPGGIGAQLTTAGISWRAYMDGMSGTCLRSPYPYALKHDPFPYYGGACPENVVPFARLADDLAGDTPRFVWITPDMCHDGHDCAVGDADAWLAQTVPAILASRAWRDGGVLFITWDESDARNQVPLLVVASELAAHVTAQRYDHYSLLATMQDLLGVPRLGHAAEADALTELLGALR